MGRYSDDYKLFDPGGVTPFGASKTAEQFVQFAIDPSKGLSKKRYGWFSNGTRFDGTNFTEDPGEITMSTTATGTDVSRLHSAFSGVYVSQALAQPGIGFVPSASDVSLDSNNRASITHGLMQWGAFFHDGTQVTTGVGMELNSSSWDIFLKSGGSHLADSPVSQADWNRDPLDGTGPSGKVVDPSDGRIWNDPYTWYNQGAFGIGYVDPDPDPNEPAFTEAHRFTVDGRPTTEVPAFPTQAVVDNDGTADALSAGVGGMQYSTYGAEGTPETRTTSVPKDTAGGGEITVQRALDGDVIDPWAEPGIPLVSFQRQAGEDDLEVTLGQANVNPTGDNVYLLAWNEWDPGTALTNSTFDDPVIVGSESRESKLQTDTVATDYTPTEAVFRDIQFYPQGQNNQARIISEEIDDRLPLDATLVITAVNAGGSNADIEPGIIRADEGY